MDYQKRARSGIIVSLAGVFFNFILAAAKITAGFLSGLVSVVADGFNNLSDCGSGAVALASFRISGKPADKEHPYGHRRAEYIASVIMGCLVVFMAVELVRESVAKLFEGGSFDGSYWVFVILGASVAVKAGLCAYYALSAKKLSSDVLKAAAIDSACDCVATSAVICGGLVFKYTGFPADGWAGIAVALFIGYQGVSLIKDSASKLLGRAPDPALAASVKKLLLLGKDVLGVHDIRVFGFGGDIYYATAHVEMPADMPAMSAHGEIDALEHAAFEKLNISLTVHLDPVDVGDEEAARLEEEVKKTLQGFCAGLELHDFRLVRGVKKKLIFEAAVPFSEVRRDRDLKAGMEGIIRARCGVEPVITVERQ